MTKLLQNASDNELAELDDAISKSLYSLTTTFVHVEDYYPEEMIQNLKQFHSLIMSEIHRREEKEFHESEQAHLEDPKVHEESKHTPAPWHIHGTEKNESGASYLRIDAKVENEDRYVGNLAHVFGNDDESKANARLIAVAPEMLELIMGIRKWYEDRWPEYIKHLEHKPTPIVFSKALGLINKVIE